MRWRWWMAFLERETAGGTVTTRSPSGRCLLFTERARGPIDEMLDAIAELRTPSAPLAEICLSAKERGA